MAGLHRPWMMPGPAAFVARACVEADRQKVIVLHAPSNAAAVAEALREHLGLGGTYTVQRIELDNGSSFEAMLAASAGIGSINPAALATSPRLDHAAIVVRMSGVAGSGLSTFVRMIRRQPPRIGPILLVVTDDGACVLGECPAWPVRDAFGPLDSAAYAAALPIGLRPLEARLVAAVAIEVAAWDVALLDRLTALPPEAAVRPDCHVASWDEGETARWRGVALAWETGCVDDWGGERVEHALWLAANRPQALAKRVWRGQLGMLLPWIERHRQLIIERERKYLKVDTIRSGPDLESLDWGPLVFQLSRVPMVKELAYVFREARNELAHGRPIIWGLIRQCVAASREYCPV